MPSSVSTGSTCHGFHASGVAAVVVGRHPSRQYSRAVRAAAAIRAGVLAGALYAWSTSTTSAAAACGHVIAIPSPSGLSACTSHRAARGPECPSRSNPLRFAVSIRSHAARPSGKAAP